MLEEKNARHGLNGLKYMQAIFAIATRTGDELALNRVVSWRILAAASSGFATIMNTYLGYRDRLGFSTTRFKKPILFLTKVLNVLLRLAWMQSVLGVTQAPFLHRKASTAVVACLEIIRLGIWNFFRLENEHFNNVGKYRAFKSVPLPFTYEDDHSTPPYKVEKDTAKRKRQP